MKRVTIIAQPGDSIQIGSPESPTPHDISSFLGIRGWKSDDSYRWANEAKGRYHMTWEQAVACEFYEFITIGGR